MREDGGRRSPRSPGARPASSRRRDSRAKSRGACSRRARSSACGTPRRSGVTVVATGPLSRALEGHGPRLAATCSPSRSSSRRPHSPRPRRPVWGDRRGHVLRARPSAGRMPAVGSARTTSPRARPRWKTSASNRSRCTRGSRHGSAGARPSRTSRPEAPPPTTPARERPGARGEPLDPSPSTIRPSRPDPVTARIASSGTREPEQRGASGPIPRRRCAGGRAHRVGRTGVLDRRRHGRPRRRSTAEGRTGRG